MSGPNPPNSSPNDGAPLNSHKVECPLSHWFDLTLNILPHKTTKPWWQDINCPISCAKDKLHLDLSGAMREQTLDGSGHVHLQQLPQGSGKATFYAFYDDILKEFETGTNFTPK
jgi:hypothetical protein